MPATPYAKLLARVNGGAPTSGGLTVALGDTIQLQAESTVGWGSPAPRWEIYGFPVGFPCPPGWTTVTVDASTVYRFTGLGPPPPFTVTVWGKYMLVLRVPNLWGELVDEGTALSIPATSGLLDLGHREAGQFGGAAAGWAHDQRQNLRTLESLAGGGTVPPTRTIAAGAGLTGGGDLTANRTLDIVALDASLDVQPNGMRVGVISALQHGQQSDPELHDIATASENGFMAAADKAKLDAAFQPTRTSVQTVAAPVHGRLAFCAELDAFYQFDSSSAASANGWTILTANDATPGRWLLVGDAITVAPMTWATFAALWTAAAASGVRVRMRPGTWTCNTAHQMPSRLHLVGSRGVVINCTLTPTGTGSPERCPFYATAPANTVSTTLAANTVLGTDTITLTSASGFSVGMEIALLTGNLMACYQIVGLAGAVATVDRTVVHPFSAGTTVVDRIVPKDIILEGHGMQVTGTYDAVVEISSGLRCHVSGIHGTAMAGSTGDVGFNFDVGSRWCSIRDCSFDGKGVFTNCFHFESAEGCIAEQLNLRGAAEYGAFITTGFGNRLTLVHAWQCNKGFGFSSGTGTIGCRSLSVDACYAVKCTGIGFDLINGSERIALSHCEARHCGGSGFAVNAGSGPSKNVLLSACVAEECQTGLFVAANCTGVIAQGIHAHRCTTYGVVNEGELVLQGLVSRDCTNGAVLVAQFGEIIVEGANVAASINGFWVGFTSQNSARLVIGDTKIAMSGTGTKIAVSQQGTGVTSLARTRTMGGTYGWIASAGFLRRGPDVDFFSCATPFETSAGQRSFGTVTLNGVTPVVHPFSIAKPTDRPRGRRTSLAGTPGHFLVDIEDGVGIRVTGQAGDTSTVEVDLI